MLERSLAVRGDCQACRLAAACFAFLFVAASPVCSRQTPQARLLPFRGKGALTLRLTPHPGPLPVEGRGDLPWCFPRTLSGKVAVWASLKEDFSDALKVRQVFVIRRRADSISPHGERAGVRGGATHAGEFTHYLSHRETTVKKGAPAAHVKHGS